MKNIWGRNDLKRADPTGSSEGSEICQQTNTCDQILHPAPFNSLRSLMVNQIFALAEPP